MTRPTDEELERLLDELTDKLANTCDGYPTPIVAAATARVLTAVFVNAPEEYLKAWLDTLTARVAAHRQNL